MQNFDHIKKAELVTGCSGTGKTTEWIKRIVKAAKKARAVFIYDHEGEIAQKLGKKAITDPDELIKATAKGGFVIFDPEQMADNMSGFDFFAEFIFTTKEAYPGRVIFCCDELQFFVDNHKGNPALLNILQRGRRREIDCFFISQAINELHNAERQQITDVVTFRQSEKAAIVWFEDQGFDPEKIRNLKNGQWLSKNTRTGEFSEGGKAF
jgi:hypothetical protein